MKSFFFFFSSLLLITSAAENADYFYFILQWPDSSCYTRNNCCSPKTGKRAPDFIINGLKPYSNRGHPLTYCDPNAQFDPSQISNLTSSLEKHWPSIACPTSDGVELWSSQWKKYGTCSSKYSLDQKAYFEDALYLNNKLHLRIMLLGSMIVPDHRFYNASHITRVIRRAVGYEPGLRCKPNMNGDSQLDLVYLCSDGERFIECPRMLKGNCKPVIKFPSF